MVQSQKRQEKKFLTLTSFTSTNVKLRLRHTFFVNFFWGVPPTLQFFKVFLTSKRGKILFFQKWPKYGLVSEKTKKKVFNFFGNRGGESDLSKFFFNFWGLFLRFPLLPHFSVTQYLCLQIALAIKINCVAVQSAVILKAFK